MGQGPVDDFGYDRRIGSDGGTGVAKKVASVDFGQAPLSSILQEVAHADIDSSDFYGDFRRTDGDGGKLPI